MIETTAAAHGTARTDRRPEQFFVETAVPSAYPGLDPTSRTPAVPESADRPGSRVVSLVRVPTPTPLSMSTPTSMPASLVSGRADAVPAGTSATTPTAAVTGSAAEEAADKLPVRSRRHLTLVGPGAAVRRAAAGEDGMTTAEYAVGTLAACAFGAVLLKVVTSDGVAKLLADLIKRALSVTL